jgi:hypothetical protein
VPLYVLALTDTPVDDLAVGDRQLHAEPIDGVYAIGEKRSAAPKPTDAELRAQHALVIEIASRVRAILPVRFGSLLTRVELRRAIREHRAEIEAAFDLVRDRVQMTIRVTGRRRAPAALPAPSSGRAYLARKQEQLSPPLPASTLALLKHLAPLVAAERREPGAGALLATVYHLVNTSDVSRYAALARKAPRSIVITGPWPPFAFTPSLVA